MSTSPRHDITHSLLRWTLHPPPPLGAMAIIPSSLWLSAFACISLDGEPSSVNSTLGFASAWFGSFSSSCLLSHSCRLFVGVVRSSAFLRLLLCSRRGSKHVESCDNCGLGDFSGRKRERDSPFANRGIPGLQNLCTGDPYTHHISWKQSTCLRDPCNSVEWRCW
jgi:hypothetical protein